MEETDVILCLEKRNRLKENYRETKKLKLKN